MTFTRFPKRLRAMLPSVFPHEQGKTAKQVGRREFFSRLGTTVEGAALAASGVTLMGPEETRAGVVSSAGAVRFRSQPGVADGAGRQGRRGLADRAGRGEGALRRAEAEQLDGVRLRPPSGGPPRIICRGDHGGVVGGERGSR